jgi:gas vesicle protein
MRATIKNFLAGLIIGAILGFPLGINFGRDEPLLSNPFTKRDLQEKVTDNVKEKAKELMNDAKETIHDATKPVRKEWER